MNEKIYIKINHLTKMAFFIVASIPLLGCFPIDILAGNDPPPAPEYPPPFDWGESGASGFWASDFSGSATWENNSFGSSSWSQTRICIPGGVQEESGKKAWTYTNFDETAETFSFKLHIPNSYSKDFYKSLWTQFDLYLKNATLEDVNTIGFTKDGEGWDLKPGKEQNKDKKTLDEAGWTRRYKTWILNPQPDKETIYFNFTIKPQGTVGLSNVYYASKCYEVPEPSSLTILSGCVVFLLFLNIRSRLKKEILSIVVYGGG